MVVLAWVVPGLVVGLIVSLLIGSTGYGVVGDIVFAILGALVVAWLVSMLMWLEPTGLNPTSIGLSVVGAVVIVLFRAIAPGRSRWQLWRR